MLGLKDKTKDLLYRYSIDLSKMVSLTNISKLTRNCYSGRDILKVVRNFKNILRRKNKTIYRYEDVLTEKDITISELNSMLKYKETDYVLLKNKCNEFEIANNILVEKNNTLSDSRMLLANELKKSEHKIKDLNDINKSLEKDLSSIKNNNVATLNSKLTDSANFILKLNNKIERLEKTNLVLKREINNLKSKKIK